jgi:peroxiredoxin Q/BCP
MLRTGENAPDFTLVTEMGESIQLSAFRGLKNVVLFFYPKDDTPGCTKEACAFRDAYAEFVRQDTVVLGIGSDSEDSHQRFASKYSLPFPLLVDEGGQVRRAYGISRTLGVIPGRATFVIDKRGIVQAAFSAQFQPEEHVRTALAALRT